MRIAYLLDRPELGGGVTGVFQHAALLAAAGHQVWVAGRGPRPAWAGEALAPGITYLDLEGAGTVAGAPPTLPAPPLLPETLDLVVATYWTTLAPARAATRSAGPESASPAPPRARAAAQLLQGYEPDWPHQRANAPEIEAAYRAAALPTLVVASHRGEAVERRHGLPWRLAPPPVDGRFSPAPARGLLSWFRAFPDRPRPRRRPWVVLPGIFEAEVKGVRVGLEAVRRLRRDGLPCRLSRISVLPQSDEERQLTAADRFLAAVPPARVAAELRAADLVLFPAQPGEGFGLPLLEAMASGVPAVASRLPSTEEMTAGCVPLVPPDDPAAFATAAHALLEDRGAWLRARDGALEAAAPYRSEELAPRLETAVAWALEIDGEAG